MSTQRSPFSSRLSFESPRRFVFPGGSGEGRLRVDFLQFRSGLGGAQEQPGIWEALADHGRWLWRRVRGRWGSNG